MPLGGIKDIHALREIQKLKAEVTNLSRQLSTVTKNNTFTFSGEVIVSDVQPDVNSGPVIWINTAALPYKAGVLLKSASGAPNYIQFGKGLPT